VVQATRRLAGLRFEAQPPPPALVLPRMDVAGFVGYASSGPLDTPVRIDDAARFAEIFGPDLTVAWDVGRAEPAYAALGPAVRSFFRNGGRRCFVVRVAGPEARTTPFQLPGIVALSGGAPAHALLRARSVGAWADDVRVAVSVSSSPLEVRPVSLARRTLDVIAATGEAVQPGDLLRVPFPPDWTLLATIATATVRLSAQTQSEDRERITSIRVVADEVLWTRAVELEEGAGQAARWVGANGARRSARARVESVRGRLVLRIRTRLARAPAEGSLVRLTGTPAETWLRVGEGEASGPDTLVAFDAFRLQTATPGGLSGSRDRRAAERLELELWTAEASAQTRLGGLGFGRRHPRFLADLPTDEALYSDIPDDRPPPWPELWRAAAEPRFALAGPAARPAAYFPVAASLLPEPWLAALPATASTQRRNGLARFCASAFVDQRLESVRTGALLAQADYLRYGTSEPDPEPLRGLHALLGVGHVTMIAIPDAAQAGWRLEERVSPEPPQVDPVPDGPADGAFDVCDSPLRRSPGLTRTGDPSTGFGLAWAPPPGGCEIEVQEATDPAFETAVALYRGQAHTLELGSRPAGRYWYRARYRAGAAAGAWSAIGPVGAGPRRQAVVRTPAEYTDGVLVSVHRALLRMCAARGDLFALLAVPEHYREDGAIAHGAALRRRRSWPRTDVPPLGEGESNMLGYGALHHPWLVVTSEDEPGELRRVPPDGATAGVLARRAAERGAWVAPANVALLDVVALSPQLAPERRLELLQAQVNGVEQTPRGFMALSADTLATDPEVRPINVRRLLQLLRRLALRHGETYAFEPNGDPLWRATRRGFEGVLGVLFRLGAFAGTRPDEGFRVVVGDPPNTPQSIDAGRLIVQLQVAPSRPLAFLTVRLVRAGDGTVRVETV
jgi:hypothetical protein